MTDGTILTAPIKFALEEAIKKYENPKTEVEKVIFKALRCSEVVWDKIKINGLEIYGFSYEEFCEQCEEKPNIVFLSDNELNDLCKALELMKVLKSYKEYL